MHLLVWVEQQYSLSDLRKIIEKNYYGTNNIKSAWRFTSDTFFDVYNRELQ